MMIRADLANIPSYVPGKWSNSALKLSSNEVTYPPLPTAVAAMSEAAATAHRYPDMGVGKLKRALAEHLDFTPEQLSIGCGSSALCQQLVQITAGPGDEVVFPWRSFEAYPIFTQVTGATPVPVALDANHRIDLDAMAQAITAKTKLIFVCNPNNPTGTTLTEKEFTNFLAAIPNDILVALDEAYFEYLRAEDSPIATELVGRYENLIGLRTFSKAYGLAGARIGYAFGNPTVIEALDKVALPFAVNSMAQAGALASLDAVDELLSRTEEVVEQRNRAADAIGTAYSEANFIWLPTEKSNLIASLFAERDIIVRAFPEGVRITITNEEETTRLLSVWETLVKP